MRKRHVLWITGLAVLVPLGLLLVMQYRWLSRLADSSALAENASLRNTLEAITDRTEDFYRDQARILDYRAEYFYEESPRDILRYYRKKTSKGIRHFFVIKYKLGEWATLGSLDTWTGAIDEPDRETHRAIQVAAAPWKILAANGEPLKNPALSVDERDPDHRIVLKPITLGDDCRVIGVTGMIVDNEYFLRRVLAESIETALPKFVGQGALDDYVVTARDERDRTVYGQNAELGEIAEGDRVRRTFPFIYTDWTISLANRDRTPEQLAKTNFILNLSLSALLGLLVIAGVVWTLRTASRDMHLSQMKSDFVSNVSHELRTPLASIRVFAEFLRLGRVNDPARMQEYGEYIETESRRLTGLVNNILDLSKIESGAKTYEMAPEDLSEVVGEAVRTLLPALKHRGFELQYDETAEDLPLIKIDRGAIAQAVANLVENAVKYSGDGRQVRIELGRSSESVLISVEDKGIGISPEEHKRIFDRFHRVGNSLVHDVKGAGLGLSIVHHIVRAHGGKIRVASEPGSGSRFTVELPCAAA